MPRDEVWRLIGPISEKATLLHGTSVQTALKLFKTGILPPGTKHWKETNGYLYFVPVMEQLPEEMRTKMPCFDREEAILSARSYAEVHGEAGYISKYVFGAGIPEKYVELVVSDFIYGEKCKIPKKVRKLANTFDWDALWTEGRKRKGVVMEIDRKLLEMGAEPDPESEGVRYHCPKGLPVKYVKRVEPQGKLERQTLRELMLKYPEPGVLQALIAD